MTVKERTRWFSDLHSLLALHACYLGLGVVEWNTLHAISGQSGIKSVIYKGTNSMVPSFVPTLLPNFVLIHFVLAPVRALAIYPLRRQTRAKDVGLYGNPPGIQGYVKPARGPDGRRDTSYQFFSRRNSYIRFPNRGRLDAKYSITLLAWIYPEGEGPIFRYGVDFSVSSGRGLSMQIFPRTSRTIRVRPLRARRVIRYRKWQYAGVTYDQRTGDTRIYVNGRLVARKRLRRVLLRTNIPATMGAGGGRYFRGRISCMQVYGRALTLRQILTRKRRCFRGKEGLLCWKSRLLWFFIPLFGSQLQRSPGQSIS